MNKILWWFRLCGCMEMEIGGENNVCWDVENLEEYYHTKDMSEREGSRNIV